jgi:hypothetical protein
MTCIAWDSKILAADRGSWSGGFHQCAKKVHRVTAPDGRKFLVGLLGNAAFAADVLRWMQGGPPPGACLDVDKEQDCAIVIDEQRRVWRLSAGRLTYREYGRGVHSGGAGQEIAMGALMAGADARKAVRITMQVSDYAARGVDSVRFV